MLTAEQQALEAAAKILPQKPDSYRGHRFQGKGNMLSGGTISESWYGCACGASLQTRVNLTGPPETHVYHYSEVLFDCPLAAPADAQAQGQGGEVSAQVDR